METKEQLEKVVYHQTQCLNALYDLKRLIQSHREDHAIHKIKDLQKQLTRITVELRQIEEHI